MERNSKRVKIHNDNKITYENNKSNELMLLNNLEFKINKIGNLCMTLTDNINTIKLQQNILISHINNLTNKIEMIEDNLNTIGIEIKEKTTVPISNDMLNAYG